MFPSLNGIICKVQLSGTNSSSECKYLDVPVSLTLTISTSSSLTYNDNSFGSFCRQKYCPTIFYQHKINLSVCCHLSLLHFFSRVHIQEEGGHPQHRLRRRDVLCSPPLSLLCLQGNCATRCVTFSPAVKLKCYL